MMTQEAFVDIVDQDQTTQNVQSDLCPHFCSVSTNLFLHLAMDIYLFRSIVWCLMPFSTVFQLLLYIVTSYTAAASALIHAFLEFC